MADAPSTTRAVKRRPTLSDTEKYARLSSITGIAFAVLLVAALVLVHSAPNLKASEADFTAFYASSNTALVTVGLYLVPFAGIAFLWHMNTVRLLIRTRTPSPSAIPDGLQLLAGSLFVALLFAGTAAAGAVALLKDLGAGPLPSMDVACSPSATAWCSSTRSAAPACTPSPRQPCWRTPASCPGGWPC
jgi:hypothetical protein